MSKYNAFILVGVEKRLKLISDSADEIVSIISGLGTWESDDENFFQIAKNRIKDIKKQIDEIGNNINEIDKMEVLNE